MDALSAMLTDMGVDGWELVVAVNGSADTQYLVFKRPVPTE